MRIRTPRPRSLAVLLVASAAPLVLGACGGDDAASSATTTTSSTRSSSTTRSSANERLPYVIEIPGVTMPGGAPATSIVNAPTTTVAPAAPTSTTTAPGAAVSPSTSPAAPAAPVTTVPAGNGDTPSIADFGPFMMSLTQFTVAVGHAPGNIASAKAAADAMSKNTPPACAAPAEVNKLVTWAKTATQVTPDDVETLKPTINGIMLACAQMLGR